MQAQKPCPGLAVLLLKVSLFCALSVVLECRADCYKHLQPAGETLAPLRRRLLAQVIAGTARCFQMSFLIIAANEAQIKFAPGAY
jgi:hypothetical protein